MRGFSQTSHIGMPFKDINFKKLNEAEELRKKLNKKVAVIKQLNDPNLTSTARIARAELLAGKPLQNKPKQLEDVIEREKAVQNLLPITAKLDELRQPHGLRQQLAIAAPYEGIDLYERLGFTDEDKAYYERERLPNLNEMANVNDQILIHDTLKVITGRDAQLGRQQGGIKRKKRPTALDVDTLEDVLKEREYIKRYKEALKRLSIGGKGIQVGKYSIPKRRLERDNIASVRYTTSNKMVPAFGATKVSNNVKNFLLNKKQSGLTRTEKNFIDKLFVNADKVMSYEQAKTVRGSGVFTSIDEISERIKVLFGELNAGNTSINLKNELAALLHYLFKHKKIKLSEYKTMLAAI